MKRFGAAIILVIALAGCAATATRPAGETTPTEALPKGVASALFPDPAWR